MWAWSSVAGALVLAALAVFLPERLAPLNRMWFRVGLVLGKIVSPIVLGLLFLLVITPVALATRLFGRDALSLKPRLVKSYWVARDLDGPTPDSFRNQF